MIVDQRFGLIPLHLLRIVRIALEVASLNDRSIDLAEICQVAVVVCPIGVGMGSRVDKRKAHLLNAVQARDQNHDLIIAALLNTPPRVDVFHHHREGREIEGHVVGQHPSRSYGDVAVRRLSIKSGLPMFT